MLAAGMLRMRLAAILLALVVLAGCSNPAPSSAPTEPTPTATTAATSTPTPTAPATPTPPQAKGNPAAVGSGEYAPDVSAADFVAGAPIDHPFLPLPVGATWKYREDAEGETLSIEVTVLSETRTIQGVQATVVHDVVRDEDGEVIEDTFDWYAQDKDGNVWYLGEDTTEFEDGEVVTKEGSWEWGVEGALPGIIMPAQPTPDNVRYYQEYSPGHAVDEAMVVAAGGNVTVPAGTFNGTLRTRESSALEAGAHEDVDHAPGVGVVRKVTVGGDEDGSQELLVEYHLPA